MEIYLFIAFTLSKIHSAFFVWI